MAVEVGSDAARQGQGKGRRRLHLLFVTSTGGHLAQLMQLESWWREHERTWVTFDKPDARSVLEGERVVLAHHPTTRHLGNLARNARLARSVLGRYRPDVVLSTGAGVALPFFVAARALRIPTVYLEVYDRVESVTMTGRLCRPFSSAFCVQWPEQVELYPGSELVGMVL
ncbi:UDP-N-acetylglucosamine--LPS N-acetylglucosamine transferase [soil metagenome]